MPSPTEIYDKAAVDIFKKGADPGQSTYVPKVGLPVTGCYVNIENAEEFSTNGMTSQFVEIGISLEYILAETGQTAKIGESFLVGTTTWVITHILENDGRFAKVVVES